MVIQRGREGGGKGGERGERGVTGAEGSRCDEKRGGGMKERKGRENGVEETWKESSWCEGSMEGRQVV